MISIFPEKISPHITKVLERLKNDHNLVDFAAISHQFVFDEKEKNIQNNELTDPLGAKNYQVTAHLIHQYKNRVLLLSTSACYAHCRFCFRKNYTDQRGGFINHEEITKVCSYLKNHSEIKEILISGGDPLTTSDQNLENLFLALREASPHILIRLCTRTPFFQPSRFSPSLFSLLRNFKPLWVIPHINHPAEISEKYSPETRKVLENLLDHGLPLQSQTVLLKNVNDNLETLVALFNDLVCLGIKPGYLFQSDLAQGISHFRVPLAKGIALYKKLKLELSGLSLPIYAVDLPGGGGKRQIMATQFVEKDHFWEYIDEQNHLWRYPKD